MLYDPKWEKKIETPPQDERWRKLLRDAADLMEKVGHARNSLQNSRGEVCLLGALNLADSGRPVFSASPDNLDARDAVARALGVSSVFGAVQWNNDPERTKAEVVAVLRQAAAS